MRKRERIKRQTMQERIRIYKVGDAIGKLCPLKHGRRTYGYGHWGWQFGYVLYVYKKTLDNGHLFTISLPPRVYAAYVKAIIKAVAETPMPERRPLSYSYWLKGKTWKPPYCSTEAPILVC